MSRRRRPATPCVVAQAANAASQAPLTRAQVRMERAEFVKTNRWDEETETGVPQSPGKTAR